MDRPTDQQMEEQTDWPKDIITYRAAIAAKKGQLYLVSCRLHCVITTITYCLYLKRPESHVVHMPSRNLDFGWGWAWQKLKKKD